MNTQCVTLVWKEPEVSVTRTFILLATCGQDKAEQTNAFNKSPLWTFYNHTPYEYETWKLFEYDKET